MDIYIYTSSHCVCVCYYSVDLEGLASYQAVNAMDEDDHATGNSYTMSS